MIDIDNEGTINLRKLNRVLLGSTTRYFTCEFSHPDSGIVWSVDEEKCACINEIEPHSIASKTPSLVQKLRVHKIEGINIPLYNPSSLSMVHRELVRMGDSELSIEFLEPVLIINAYNCMLG